LPAKASFHALRLLGHDTQVMLRESVLKDDGESSAPLQLWLAVFRAVSMCRSIATVSTRSRWQTDSPCSVLA
jgi:hypothetical protein